MSPISDGSELTCPEALPPNKVPIVYWLGIGKLGEEAGEVNQLVGKAIAFPIGEHPDGKGPVRDRFIEELGERPPGRA